MIKKGSAQYEEKLLFFEKLIKVRAKALSLSKNYFNLNNDSAEDVAQEVCLSFIRNYENIENLNSWIFGAVKRQSAYYLRKEEKTNPKINIEENYDINKSIIFLDLIQKLNKLCKNIIIYVLFFGYTEREIGELLNIKNSTLHN